MKRNSGRVLAIICRALEAEGASPGAADGMRCAQVAGWLRQGLASRSQPAAPARRAATPKGAVRPATGPHPWRGRRVAAPPGARFIPLEPPPLPAPR